MLEKCFFVCLSKLSVTMRVTACSYLCMHLCHSICINTCMNKCIAACVAVRTPVCRQHHYCNTRGGLVQSL